MMLRLSRVASMTDTYAGWVIVGQRRVSAVHVSRADRLRTPGLVCLGNTLVGSRNRVARVVWAGEFRRKKPMSSS